MTHLDSRAFLAFCILCGAVLPGVALAIVVAALLGQAVITAMHLLAAASRPRRPAPQAAGTPLPRPRFSIHVATHSEPPQIVADTLRALAAQVGAPPFEVIVLDNNTDDPALWRPIERLCRSLGPRFRFFHEDGVTGAKAGALNIALARSAPEASHVVVIDADYRVAPDFLRIAARELAAGADDFLQFPQAYRHDTGSAAGLSLELADYFLRHARKADSADAMLMTGTLSVVRRAALESVGGWSGQTVTEDAELGLRLRRHGYRGRFIDRIVGRGLLPLDYASLAAQRYRWALGNLRTLWAGLGGLSPRAAAHVVSQLTAWTNLALPFAGVLAGGGLAVALGTATPLGRRAADLAGAGLAVVVAAAVLPLVLAAILRRRPPLPVVLRAVQTRLALLLPSALATVDALLGQDGTFHRTSKDIARRPDPLGAAPLLLALAGLGLAALPDLTPLARLGGALLVLPLPLILGTRARLADYRAELDPA